MPSDSEPTTSAASDDDELLELVVSCLDRMEREGAAALESLCAEHPLHASRLRSRVAHLGAFGLAHQSGERMPERLGPFRLLARLGGGGMGVVYAAEQEGLQRRVALKLVRPGQVFVPGARERFRREVDALARLSHPGIVPVFTGGEDNGVPYLAMELVRGATLDEALAQLAGRDPATLKGADLHEAVLAVVARRDLELPPENVAAPGAPATNESSARGVRGSHAALQTPSPERALPRLYSGAWVTSCVRLARRVAEALAHAHERGVLHRDVKPSNVMLTPEGRVLLLDFGLASAEGSVRLTGSAQPVGSPASMSPEQVRGDRGAIDARSDVYSLGVLLYEALTLHQPFVTDSLQHTARLVLAGAPPAPRERNPGLPRDVVTVVTVAMDRDRERRYASAADFARDLQHILDLRTIEARPPGVTQRLLRWMQRHPALATAGVLGALLLVAGPVGWELSRARSMGAITSARDQSERDFRAALSAVGHVLRESASEDLEDVPRMQRARLAMLDRALELFPQLQHDRPDDLLVLSEGAELHRSRGDVLRDLGRPEEGFAEYQLAVDVRRQLLERDGSMERRQQLSVVIDDAAKARFAVGQADAALPLHAEALQLLRVACAAHPDAADWRHDLALELANQAESLRALGRFEEVRTALDEALTLVEGLIAAQPGDLKTTWLEARVAGDLASLHWSAGESEAALPWLTRSLEAYTRARDATPGSRAREFDVAQSSSLLAQCLLRLGRTDEGEAMLRDALGRLDELLREFPDVERYRNERRLVQRNLGISAAQHGRLAEAIVLLEACVNDTDDACSRHPDRRDLALASAEALNNLEAALVDAHERLPEVLALAERCEARLALLFDGTASPPPNTGKLRLMTVYNRARALCYMERVEDARQACEDFEERFGTDATGLRFAADLWNEFVLSLRGSAAALGDEADGGGAPVDAEGRVAGAAAGDATARMYALLQRAIDAGYADRSELSSTPSLDSFRSDPEFLALMEQLNSAP